MITEIVYGNSFKINKGNYEQEAPLYSAKVIIDGEVDEKAQYERLKGIVDPLLMDHVAKTKTDLSKVRIRMKDGKQYPSVTSILSPDPLPIDPEYATRGLEIDRLFHHKIQTGEWLEPAVALANIPYDTIKYKQWWDKFDENIDWSLESKPKTLWNETHFYSGKCDIFECRINDIVTLADIKCGAWDWQQLVAYWHCDPIADQVAVFDLKKCEIKTLEPKSEQAQVYWEKFLIKLGIFRSRFLNGKK